MRLINADAFSEQYGDYYAEQGPEEGFIGTVGDLIAKQPTIEPKRGEWVQYSRNADETYIECSNCCVASRPRHLQMVTRTGSGLPDYCPNCGAKMYQTGGTISKEQFAEIMRGYDDG